MNEFLAFLLACVFVFCVKSNIFSQQVNQGEAITVALNSLRYENAGVSPTDIRIDTVLSLKRGNNTLLYNVIINESLSILVAGYKGCTPILGVCDGENPTDLLHLFDESAYLPPPFRGMVNQYANQVQYCIEHSQSNNANWQLLLNYDSTKVERSIIVDALITSKWGQKESNDNSPQFIAYNMSVLSRLWFSSTLVTRHSVSDDVWENLIRTNLDSHYPIYYVGMNINDGHAFICDGYK